MSTPNYSRYFDSLLMMNRGEKIGEFSKKVVKNLENWGYIVVLDDEIIITQKGLNVLEFYLRNKDFLRGSTDHIQRTLIASIIE